VEPHAPAPLDYEPNTNAPFGVRVRRAVRVVVGRRARRLYFRFAGFLFSAAMIGYASNLISQRSCESATARHVRNHVLWPNPFFVRDAKSDGIFRRAGFPPTSRNAWGPPWTGVGIDSAALQCPFVVTVEYHFNSSQWLEGGSDTYVCVFGLCFQISHDDLPHLLIVH
jgi:hypothetical protein